VYAGAGISVAAGIDDYASSKKVKKGPKKKVHPKKRKPTLAHHVIT